MTLADAIRKGAMQRPQCDGLFVRSLVTGEVTRTCVLAAAHEGVFGAPPGVDGEDEDTDAVMTSLIRAGYDLLAHVPECPQCGREGGLLGYTLFHLNDDHEWTREAIADWLDTLPEADRSGPAATPTP